MQVLISLAADLPTFFKGIESKLAGLPTSPGDQDILVLVTTNSRARNTFEDGRAGPLKRAPGPANPGTNQPEEGVQPRLHNYAFWALIDTDAATRDIMQGYIHHRANNYDHSEKIKGAVRNNVVEWPQVSNVLPAVLGPAAPHVDVLGVKGTQIPELAVLWFIIQLMRAKHSLFPRSSDRGKKAKNKPQVNPALEPIYHATRAVEKLPDLLPLRADRPTAKYMGIRDGLNLVVAPKRLLPVWVKEWNDTVKAHSLLNMTLLLGHGPAIQGVKTVKGFEGKGSLMVAEAEQWLHAWYHSQDADRFEILSAPRSVSSHVLETLTLYGKAPKPAAGSGPRISVNGARFARAFRDECHEEKGDGTTVKVFDYLRQKTMPDFWMLSGTPFETSPSDVAFYMGLLEKSRRAQHQAQHFCTSEKIKQLGQRFSDDGNLGSGQNVTNPAKFNMAADDMFGGGP
ncbi:uncharacterized protein Aud_001233 [Aspergillus udagawae]|uniref:Uncharacterized protein n=1 Tax=Aspergillus udagawae TaxID=91492 RepID=A0A8E0QK13_9EURO|nr:uncharacterized protein Aud_001233 [Aspergillus udagawae]GIC85402.1 hypothetical protein Aud_001233 [Aspergillus udagawae]